MREVAIKRASDLSDLTVCGERRWLCAQTRIRTFPLRIMRHYVNGN